MLHYQFITMHFLQAYFLAQIAEDLIFNITYSKSVISW